MDSIRCLIWLAVFPVLVSYLTHVDTKKCSILQIKAVVLNTVPAYLEVILLLKKKLHVTDLSVVLNRFSVLMASEHMFCNTVPVF